MSDAAAGLVDTANQRMQDAAPGIATLGALLDKKDLPGLTDFAKQKLPDTVESIASQFDKLAEIQIGVANGDYLSAQSLASQAAWTMAAIGGLSGCILLYALSVVLGGVAAPLRQMEGVMRRLAAGDLSVEIPHAGRQDEIGQMAAAVHIFRENGLRVQALTEAEIAGSARAVAERGAMMAQLQRDFGDVVDAAAAGDFSKRVEAKFPDRELNALAESVNSLVTTVDRGMAEVGTVLTALAGMDLTKRVAGEFAGAFQRLKDDTNSVAEKLTDIVGRLKETSGALRMATGEILSGANDLSERTTRQAAAIEETSTTIEQLAATVTGNASKAEAAHGKAGAVRTAAEESGKVMALTTLAMEQITASSGKISNIIGMIDDIAFQTNLLALNASVEAARAGDAGKGFAVVAVEVRRLAQSAAQASNEIKQLIDQSANEVRNGSRLVFDASLKLQIVLEGIRENTAALDEIAKASREQASSIAEVTTAVRAMDEMTQHNAALVEETNAAIEQTEAQARQLDQVVYVFTLLGTPPDAELFRRTLHATPIARGGSGVRELQSKIAKSYRRDGNPAVTARCRAFRAGRPIGGDDG